GTFVDSPCRRPRAPELPPGWRAHRLRTAAPAGRCAWDGWDDWSDRPSPGVQGLVPLTNDRVCRRPETADRRREPATQHRDNALAPRECLRWGRGLRVCPRSARTGT